MSTLVNEVPDTGSSGQALKKTGTGVTDYAFQTILEVPSGGSTGQVLTKTASGYAWQTPSGGGMQIHQSLRYLQSTFPSDVVNYTVPSGMYSNATSAASATNADQTIRQASAGTVITGSYVFGSTSYVRFDNYKVGLEYGVNEFHYLYIVTFKN